MINSILFPEPSTASANTKKNKPAVFVNGSFGVNINLYGVPILILAVFN